MKHLFGDFDEFIVRNWIYFAVEHILSLISIGHYTTTCFRQDDAIDTFLKVQVSEIFVFMSYSSWLAIVGKFTNIVATFCWTFMDLFVMIIGISLSTRFKQINDDLQRIKGQVSEMISVRFKLNHPISLIFNKNVIRTHTH